MSEREIWELIEKLDSTNPYVYNPAEGRLLKLGVRAAPALIETIEGEDIPGSSKAAAMLLLNRMKIRNYSELKFILSAARKARREGKPNKFNAYVRCYLGWAEDLRKGADYYVSKNFPKPKIPRNPDSVKRVQLRRAVL